MSRLAQIPPFSFFHSKKKSEGTYDLPYWDRAGNKMVLWNPLLVIFGLMDIFQIAVTQPISASTSFSNANWCRRSDHWISFLDRLNCFILWFIFFFFSEIENTLSPVRAYSFGIFLVNKVENLLLIRHEGKKSFMRNVLIHLIIIYLLHFFLS